MALGLAVASAIALLFTTTSGNPGGLAGGIIFLAAAAAVVFSARYTYRTYRRLPVRSGTILKWVMLSIALMINGIVCFMMAGLSAIALGVLLTGRGIAG